MTWCIQAGILQLHCGFYYSAPCASCTQLWACCCSTTILLDMQLLPQLSAVCQAGQVPTHWPCSGGCPDACDVSQPSVGFVRGHQSPHHVVVHVGLPHLMPWSFMKGAMWVHLMLFWQWSWLGVPWDNFMFRYIIIYVKLYRICT